MNCITSHILLLGDELQIIHLAVKRILILEPQVHALWDWSVDRSYNHTCLETIQYK